ncbi:MAG TPA: tetratricopeptide repeat protein [Acidimicrobiales bacterium]
MSEPSPDIPLVTATGSGAVAAGDVSILGTYAAGRDLHIGQVQIHEAERPWQSPAQLPRDIDDFTGREDVLADALAILDRDAAGIAAPVLTVFGKPGVGKTAFAVRLAHRLRARFPDGQLYVNLRGVEAQRLDPSVVLADFLDAVGVPQASVPAGLDARERLYRARLAGRRVLVVLDNAATEAQVRPLLPGAPECAVVVTSRQPLHGLDVTRRFPLDVFDPEQAVELLARTAGTDRVAAEPVAAAEIAALCGCLPLAIRIAGARLAAKLHWNLERMATRLSDERRRLDELQGGDREVRASFQLSYEGRDPLEQRAFRLLGLLTFRSFPAWVIAVLLDDPDIDAEDLAEDLVDAQLLEPDGADETGEPRFRLHDLLRLFARERVDGEEPEQAGQAAVTRIVDTYLALATVAEAGLGRVQRADEQAAAPDLPLTVGRGHADALGRRPLAWLRIEKDNLVAAAVQARDAGLWRQAWGISRTLNSFFIWHAHWDDSLRVKDVALDAARRAGDRHAEALVLFDLGGGYLVRNDWAASIDHLERSRALLHDLGETELEVEAVLHLGVSYRDYARYDAAVVCYREVLPKFRELGNELLEASTYHNLGLALREQGDVHGAIECFERCLPVFTRRDDHIGRARALHSLGVALRYLGRHDEAEPHYELSLQLCRGVGDLRWEGILLLSTGRLRRRQGRLDEAAACFQEALPLFLRLGDIQGEAQTYRSIGAVLRDRGDLAGSAAYLDRAHELMAGLAHERGVGQVRHAIACTQVAAGATDDAVANLRACVAIFRSLGDQPWQVRSLGKLGAALAAQADAAGAAAAWREAADVLAASRLPAESPLRAWLGRLAAGGAAPA